MHGGRQVGCWVLGARCRVLRAYGTKHQAPGTALSRYNTCPTHRPDSMIPIHNSSEHAPANRAAAVVDEAVSQFEMRRADTRWKIAMLTAATTSSAILI